MSRGYGWVESAIVDLLGRGGKFSTEEVGEAVFQERPLRKVSLASTRRALTRLASIGVIFDRSPRFHSRYKRWSVKKIAMLSTEWSDPDE